MSENKDKQDTGSSASNADEPKGWAGLIWRLFREYRGDFLKMLAVVLLGIGVADPLIRRLFNGLFGNINERGRRLYLRANRLAQAAAISAMQGLIVAVILTTILLWVMATKSAPEIRLPMGVITTLLLVIDIVWIFGRTATFVLVWGLVNGFLSNQQVAEFKNLGGFGFLRILFSGAKSGVSGALGNLWKVGQKFGQTIRWVTIVSLLGLILPLQNVGILLWFGPLIILGQISLHTFNHRNDRDEGWQFLHRSSLWVIASLAWLSIVPELTTILSMLWKPDLTWQEILRVLHFSFYVRLGLAILGGLFVRSFIILPAIKNATRPNEVGGATTAGGATEAAGAFQSVKPSAPPKPNYMLRAIGPVTLAVMFFGGLFIAGQLFHITDRFTTIRGWNIDGTMRGVNAAGVASATTLPEPVTSAEPSVEVTKYTVQFEAGVGLRMDELHPVSVEPGDSLDIVVTQGTYSALGAVATVDGTWDGVAIRPIDNSRDFTDRGYTPDFVNNDDPFGVLYAQIGPDTEPIIIGSGRKVLCNSKGDLGFKLNIPQRKDDPQMAAQFSGQIVLTVTRTRRVRH